MFISPQLSRLWGLPSWAHYGLAVLSCGAIVAIRLALSSVSADRMQYLLFTFAVCVSALTGGLGPGLFAAGLAIFLGATILPRFMGLTGSSDTVVIFAFIALWIFISVICDVLRKSALGYRMTILERDAKDEILNAILQQTTDGLLTIDSKGTVTLANESVGEMLGIEEVKLVGTSISYLGKFLQSQPDWMALCAQAHQNSNATVDVETFNERWLHFRLFPERADSCSIFVQDITIRKNLEINQLQMLAAERNARSHAEESNRLKDGFLAMLSHELRTPLTSILGWTELLVPQAPEGSMMGEGLAAILRSTQMQKSLIDQLLDMSRITTGKMVIERHLLDIGDVVGEAVNGMRPTAQAKNIDLRFHGLDDSCVLLGDESRLIQILNNLITNAIKFSAEGTVVEVNVHLLGADTVQIMVKDQGEGISSDLLPVIFDPFQQADSSITRQHGGMGLGLALAKQLTLQHDGKISAQSDGLGKGATFQLTLPIKGMMKAKESDLPESLAPDALSGSRILLVEDDDSTRSILAVLMRSAGAEVFAAESGLKALKVLEEEPIDLLVSDIGMPMMDGFELIRQVRSHPLPRIAGLEALSLSAFAFKEDVEAAMAAGFNGCLTKPVTATVLIRELSRHVPGAKG